jgi:hypothetical protein
MKTNSDESLRVLLRLLIDESVEDLSRSGTGCRAGQFKNQICLGDPASYWARQKGILRRQP